MGDLFSYVKAMVERAGKQFVSGEVFAKVLTPNDDSGRHGVLIPTDAYSYFPNFPIPDITQNATEQFMAFDSIARKSKTLAYKYYERYPERRITRLSGVLNDVSSGPRLLVFLCAKHKDGSSAFYFDCANSSLGGRFDQLYKLVFGAELAPAPGRFLVRPVDSSTFAADTALAGLLGKFDEVRAQGWIDSMRAGDTGIGYTFETLIGIKENNDQTADFNGIEIKCKGLKDGVVKAGGKINLFQEGPVWLLGSSTKERIRILGQLGEDQLYSCYSQVTTAPNNLGLLLKVLEESAKIDLLKNTEEVGFWRFLDLERRLLEKHSRAAFIKAKTRRNRGVTQFSYEELVYCDKPSIRRFVDLVSERSIVFEFLLAERASGAVRNRGYPWRLIREEFLDQLFSFQIKLR